MRALTQTLSSLALLLLFTAPAWGQTVLKPSPDMTPERVVIIQLQALQSNDEPEADSGIRQVWEFAHPNNRVVTGPLPRFASMIRSAGYAVLLNHVSHKVTQVSVDGDTAFFAVELIGQDGRGYGFRWMLTTAEVEGEKVWMTIGVSPSEDMRQRQVWTPLRDGRPVNPVVAL